MWDMKKYGDLWRVDSVLWTTTTNSKRDFQTLTTTYTLKGELIAAYLLDFAGFFPGGKLDVIAWHVL